MLVEFLRRYVTVTFGIMKVPLYYNSIIRYLLFRRCHRQAVETDSLDFALSAHLFYFLAFFLVLLNSRANCIMQEESNVALNIMPF